AMWAWERALALEPDADDARYNLEQARKVAARRVHDKLEGADRDPAWIRGVTELPVSTEVWIFVAVYAAFFVALGLRFYRRRGRGPDEGSAWGAVCAIFRVGSALAAALLVGRVALDKVPFAIVIGDDVQVKEGAD